MKELVQIYSEARDKFLMYRTKQEGLLAQLKELEGESETVNNQVKLFEESISFVEGVAFNERRSITESVESLITTCLHSVYDETYSLSFKYGVRASRSVVDIYLVKETTDGMRIERGIDGIGGGVADAISFPLKLTILLNDDTFSKVLICDEQGKYMDKKRIERFGAFLKNVSDELDVQIIFLTHHESLMNYADVIHGVSIDGSVSKVERLK